jgi:hypothetical protein
MVWQFTECLYRQLENNTITTIQIILEMFSLAQYITPNQNKFSLTYVKVQIRGRWYIVPRSISKSSILSSEDVKSDQPTSQSNFKGQHYWLKQLTQETLIKGTVHLITESLVKLVVACCSAGSNLKGLISAYICNGKGGQTFPHINVKKQR